MKEKYTVPSLIHFIWAGGKKPLPNKNLDCILQWKCNDLNDIEYRPISMIGP